MTPIIAVFALAAIRAETPVVFEGMPCHQSILLAEVDGTFKDSSLKPIGAKIQGKYPQINWIAVKFSDKSLAKNKQRLSELPGILRVEPDRAAFPAYTPNDPIWPDMWHAVRINANTAWDLSFGSPIPVAIIDTGVDRSHPDLAANVWSNAGEIPGNSIDDDQNGYVDDVNGYDFAYLDANPDDQFGHGTACSGLVGAVQDNNIGVTGVAPRARIMALKACYDSGYFYDHMTIPAYLYAADNGARVLSMSYFCDHVSAGERVAIDYCWAHGVLPVAAAANESSSVPLYPAGYENVLSVAAFDQSDQKAGFSNFGTWVDVIAPGVQLRTVTAGGGYTYGFAGTSGACPQVAGLATLLFGTQPLATNAQVRAAIEDTAISQVQYPFGEYTNYGLVNCRAASQAILGPAAARRSSLVRYATPIAFDMRAERAAQITRIYGRGFQAPATIQVLINGEPLPILNRSRDWIDVENPSVRGTLVVKVGGVTVATIVLPSENRQVYPAIEASTQGATLLGGFYEMLNADGNNLTCTRRDDGLIFVESTFRRVDKNAQMLLTINRRYLGTANGTETISLYDWSSASYPYGNFVTVSSSLVPTSATQSTYAVPNASRFVDDEGTVICHVTASGVDNGASVQLDVLRYVVP